MINLTIAIPSYNRNLILKRNIKFILPQLGPGITLLIIDNNSDIPLSETLSEELHEYSNIKLIRNNSNIGVSGNFIKCIENCLDEYMWLLGDDEQVLPNAVFKIREHIISYPDFTFINFKCEMTINRNSKVVTYGVTELIEKLDSFGNFIFFSLGVYNIPKVSGQLRFAYLFSYSLAPQAAIVLSSLGSKGIVILSDEEIVITSKVDGDPLQRWSPLPVSLGIITLLELPLAINPKTFQLFANHLNTMVKDPSFTFKVVIKLPELEENFDKIKYFYEQVYFRSLSTNRSLQNYLNFKFYSFLMRRSFIKVILFLYKKRKKNFLRVDRYERF